MYREKYERQIEKLMLFLISVVRVSGKNPLKKKSNNYIQRFSSFDFFILGANFFLNCGKGKWNFFKHMKNEKIMKMILFLEGKVKGIIH